MEGSAKTSRGSATRARILNCALRLMWRHGYAAISVNRIIEEAGVLNGSFYHFFPSKLDLLLAMFDHLWTMQRRQLARIYDTQASPEETLRRHMAWLCDAQIAGKREQGFVPGLFHMSAGITMVEDHPAIAAKIRGTNDEHMAFLVDIMNRITPGGAAVARYHARALASFATGAIFLARIYDSLEWVETIPPFVENTIAELRAGTAAPGISRQ
ncbi:MAG: TetR/AcrR family transcriptional regulator [Novosphingobium sp.]|nr:TetR/AcrR family transcriptional regulator [Novosphingobium sp.]